VVLGLFIALALYGCAQKTLPTAVKLSEAGQEAATQLRENTVLTNDQLRNLNKYAMFHAAFRASACQEKKNKDVDACIDNLNTEKEILTTINSIHKVLDTYAAWIVNLRKSYVAMGELASNDASAKFITAFDSLSASTGTLAAAIGVPSPSTELTNIFRYAGGKIVGFVQANKIIDASKAIHAELNQAIELLSEYKRKEQYTSLQQAYIRSLRNATLLLSSQGALSFKPLVSEIGSSAGLAAASDTDKLIRNNKHLRIGLNAVIVEIYKQKLENIALAYDKSLEALTALVKVHAELEKEAGIDLTQLTSLVDQLKVLAAKIDTQK
jgi:hypothetical protein